MTLSSDLTPGSDHKESRPEHDWRPSDEHSADPDRRSAAATAAAPELASTTAQEVLERISDGFAALDHEWRFTYVNARAAELLRRPREVLLGESVWTASREAITERVRAAYERAMTTQQPVAFEDYISAWGCWFEQRVYPSPNGLSIFFTDITERRRAEDALRWRERDFSTLAENIPDVVCRFDRELRYIYANRACERMKGIARSKLLGKTNEELGVSVPQSVRWNDRLARVFAEGQPDVLEFAYLTPDGPRWIEARVVPEFRSESEPNSEVVSVLVIGRDLTEAHSAIEALRESEARFRSLVEATAQIVWRTGPDGTPVDDMPGWQSFTGRSAERLFADSTAWLELVHPDDRVKTVATWKRALATGQPADIVHGMLRADGEWRLMRGRAVPVRNPDGSVREWIGAHTDVTDRVRAQEALREREARLEEAQRIGHIGSWTWNYERDTGTASAEYFHLLGVTLGEFTPSLERFSLFIYPDDRADFMDAVRAAHARGEPYTEREFRIIREDRQVRWILARIEWKYAPSGAVKSAVGTLQDITERKQSEAVLRESEERFRQTFEMSAAGMVTIDPNFRLLQVNPAFCRFVGYSQEELLQRSVLDITYPDDRQLTERAYGELRARRRQVADLEKRFIRKDGQVVWGHVNAVLLYSGGRPTYHLAVIQDVTERRRAEERLREVEARVRMIVNSAPLIVFATDSEGILTLSEGKGLQMMGRGPGEVVGRSALELYGSIPVWESSGERSSFGDVFRRVMRGESISGVSRADGVYYDTWYIPLKANNGRIVGMTGIAMDITQRKRAEEELRRSEERYRSLVAASAQVVWTTDPEGRVDDMPEWRALTGQSREEVKGRGWMDAIHPDDRARIAREWAEAVRSRRVYAGEFAVRMVDGTNRHFVMRGVPVLNEYGSVREWVGTCSDLTERRTLEEQLRQAQKMEAVGQLAGGVAHDFNNLLTAIFGNLELARSEMPPGSRGAEDLDEVRRAAERAAQLTRQLLAFSRKQVLRPRVLDLNAVVADSERLLRRVLPETVMLDVALAPSACIVRADPGQLEQVLLNLVLNARDALQNASGGMITVETGEVELDPVSARAWSTHGNPPAAGAYIRLAVRDTGVGMSAETLAHIFEPFFTTKPVGRGTGLGLATVYGIVIQSGGAMRVESAPGAGSTFTVLLPRVNEPVDGSAQVRPGAPRGQETVLLVEDEAAVRATARRILERHGYAVVEARHGRDALLEWKEREGNIDLLLTDLRMPEMGGRELAEALRAERPELPVLFMSGYVDGVPEASKDSLGRGQGLVEKPFTADALLRAVRDALDARRAAR